MEMEAITTEHLGHLGILASIIDELNLIKKIDQKLPISKNKGAKVSMGKRVAAMIYNGLGFLNDRMYMHSQFFEDKPLKRLLGEDITANNLNDDALGNCLDAISNYGVTKFISELAFDIACEKKLLGKMVRIDTTSLSVFGDYEEQENNSSMKINYGYSKQKRFDLKQIILSLTMMGDADLPVWIEGLNGNSSDKKTIKATAEKIKNFCKHLKDSPEFIYVADSAMYNKELLSSDLRWISRVPESIKIARELVEHPFKKLSWEKHDIEGYKYVNLGTNYHNCKQRWQLIFSEKSHKKQSGTLKKNIVKEKESLEKLLKRLSKQIYDSSKDCENFIKDIQKKQKYHNIQYEIHTIKKYKNKGKPKKGERPDIIGFIPSFKITLNKGNIIKAKNKCGRFIIATNELNSNELSDSSILTEYKNQSKVERGFKFIKSKEFMISSIYLKKASRIEALMAIMTLCLFVYNFGQYKLRKLLKENKDTIPNQVKKETDKPTFRWVFRVLNKVNIVKITIDSINNIIKEVTSNLCVVCKKIVKYFGPKALEIYGIG